MKEFALKTLQDTATALPRVEPRDVAAALGADASAETLEDALAPISLFALRQELAGRRQSGGRRPALFGTTRSITIRGS